MTWALLDADLIAFKAAAGVKATYDWGDGAGATVAGNPEAAHEAALLAVRDWMVRAGCTHALAAFTGPYNFRKTVLPTYKAARKGVGKPPDYWSTVAAIKDRYPSVTIPGLEADDVLGILSTTDTYAGNSVVVSADKDLKGIPGRLFNPGKDTKPATISEAEADHFWLLQTLMGDPTDGYTGIPGMGVKGATKLLGLPPLRTPLDSAWAIVTRAYSAAKLTHDHALQQARVARILRRTDYDKATKEVLLWHPIAAERLSLATVCGA